jgi:hypothetical protein
MIFHINCLSRQDAMNTERAYATEPEKKRAMAPKAAFRRPLAGTLVALVLGGFVLAPPAALATAKASAVAPAGLAPQDPTDPALYTAPAGEMLAFGVQEGNIRNYFHRQGPVAVHLLTRSGPEPRLIAAFPAGNQGIGVWFDAEGDYPQIWAGAAAGPADAAAVGAGGGVTAVVREAGEKDLYGVRATVKSDAAKLTAYLALLANVRTLRDFGYGLCLENASQFAELRNETIEFLPEDNVVRVRRQQIGGTDAMELLIKGGEGTTLTVTNREFAARPHCQATAGPETERLIEIAGPGGVQVEIIALSTDEPLTPIDKADLLVRPPADSFEFNALAFLSYAEKLQAGAWRFLTYFGRDTLLSVRMLMPGLKRDVVEAALTAVIERINLRPGLPDPAFGYTVEVGEVAHEEELADYAAWKNLREAPRPADLRQPRYDYKMIDDDFLLAPVLVDFIAKIRADIPDPAQAAAAIQAFLARPRPDGAAFRTAIEANLQLVLDRAGPFADDPAAPADKIAKLVSLKALVPVGQWRDSDMGIAFGRYAFDVNAGLVPGALDAARTLYTELGDSAKASEAAALRARWTDIDELFRVERPLAEVQADVADYAADVGITDTSRQLQPEPDGQYRYYGIALDGNGRPLPVLHTDHGFVMEFTNPSEAYLTRAARTLGRDFPAGLMSDVGVMVANPALAPAEFVVTDPKDLRTPADDVVVTLRGQFTSSHYHGTVVWSWQQALLASGLRRQIERADIAAATRAALQDAECALWRSINLAEKVRAGELWSWAADAQGRLEYRAFGYNRTDVDESNAAQLWSTVYLVVKEPTPAQNARCAPVTP